MFSKQPTLCEIQSEQTLPLLMEAISTATQNHKICDSLTATNCKDLFKGKKLEAMDCIICKLWTKLVAKKIISKSSQVKHYFELLCNSSKLNARGKQQCMNLFEDRFDEAFQALVNMFVNAALCDYGHFCFTRGKNITEDIPTTDKDYSCTVCQSFAAYVEWAMEKKDFEDYYMKLLHKFCSFFPKDAQEQCTSFMDSYAKKFMEDAALIFSPDIFCPVSPGAQ
ncbi:Unknown (protein for IMAGE:7068038) [Trichuris trichiura]|uniref:Saposin B-type domain-containing protein n=1 Tax=Trichuris trichiura TaxID=36087 RepID=A0A077Z6P6_TRITR|nr:Unknown (protein for IMAGE:7068038) [Trichuris trichiura]